MKKRIYIVLCLSAMLMTSGCGKFGDINDNPNLPQNPDTRFLYIGAVRQALPTFYINDLWDAWTLFFPQYVSEKNNIQFTNFGVLVFNTSNYYTCAIRNLELIMTLNADQQQKNQPYVIAMGDGDNQIAVARTLRAYIYMHLTDALGMLPYSKANQGDMGNFQPVYDSQEYIYADLNKELEESWEMFDESKPLDSDYEILYNGDIAKWKKFNASVRMQMAIKLFKVAPETGKRNFVKAYNQGFIRDNADILSYKYLNEESNQNPMYSNIVIEGRRDYWPSSTIVEMMKSYNDPRLKAYFTQAKTGGYAGITFGLFREQSADIDANTISYWNENFYRQDAPAVLITPSVMLLAAAEAAERGWIDASAKELYSEAITASLEQHNVGSEAKDYLSTAKVLYNEKGTQAYRLEQIGMQKWFASFFQDGFEAWADYRRLGVPALKVGNSAAVTQIPRRRIYDVEDYETNRDNYEFAIKEQGPDLPTTRVWWDVQP